jgi:hypothetical protein
MLQPEKKRIPTPAKDRVFSELLQGAVSFVKTNKKKYQKADI